ncbi:helix-turn-helix domain-containing protein [Tabrizicola sp.]|uniref:helix-turn-helix domain-containing protein n=1 Tax=Tabrizicola sp. TaxID=2005166 RepID=UPI002FDDBFA6
MDIPQDFAGRLRLALKQANVSPAALGAAVGVDKSVVSRWISGRVRPTQHNVARIASVLAQSLPGFTVMAFEAPAPTFRALVQPVVPVIEGEPGQSLPIPFGLLEAARRETGRRGVEYFGAYLMYYRAFSQPEKIARMALMLRPEDGLIGARYGAEGFAFQGWALLMLNRMYVILAEERFEAMAFLVLNAGQQPKARFITGILSGPAEGLLVPTASPVVLQRQRDLTEDPEADLAAHLEDCRLDPLIDHAEVPPPVRRVLDQALDGVRPLLQVPFATGGDES